MTATPAQKLQVLLDGPAMAPPRGLTSNFIDPQNRQHDIIVALTLCMTLAAIAILMRMYTKLFIIRKMASEDCEFRCGALCSHTDQA